GELDGVEVVHPVAYRHDADARGFRWRDMVDFYAELRATRPVAAIGSSDHHFFRMLGVCRTWVWSDTRTVEGVLDAVRRGRTVAVAPDGQIFGDPAFIQALRSEAPELLRTSREPPPEAGY